MLSQLGFGLVLFLAVGDAAAGETQYLKLSDGSMQATYPNGIVVQLHPNGAKTTTHPTGERVVVSADGVRTDVSNTGAKTTYLPDGRRLHQEPDGLTVVTHPDGRRDIIQNGRIVEFNAQGQPVAVGQLALSGAAQDKKVTRPDGSEMVINATGIYVLHPDKTRKWSILYSGDRTLFFADGRKIVEQGDTRLLYDAQGQMHLLSKLPDDYWPLPADMPGARPNEAGTSQPISR